MPRLAPDRYKPGPDEEMRRTWNGNLLEEFTTRDTLAFMADADLLLDGRVSAETLYAIHAAGYDYDGVAVIPMPGKDETGLSKDVILTPEQIAAEKLLFPDCGAGRCQRRNHRRGCENDVGRHAEGDGSYRGIGAAY